MPGIGARKHRYGSILHAVLLMWSRCWIDGWRRIIDISSCCAATRLFISFAMTLIAGFGSLLILIGTVVPFPGGLKRREEAHSMTISNILQQKENFEIQTYRKPRDMKGFRRQHIPFAGSPRKHPYEDENIILVGDPYTRMPFYYEFRKKDIAYVEELPNITSEDGETVTMVRVWVKKDAVGLRCTPFAVMDLPEIINRRA